MNVLTHANAYPTKRFFLQMFTRDISVEDCLLDLIDNSIDALIRTRDIDISAPWSVDESTPEDLSTLPTVDLRVSPSKITLVDKCGGIDEKLVPHDLFGFGHTKEYQPGILGAYGVGLKRALFKLGNRFDLKSRTTKTGFHARLDVVEWAKRDRRPKDWQIPVTALKGVRRAVDAGTTIAVADLHQEVAQRLKDPTTENRLRKNVAQAYTLFLDTYVRVTVNGAPVSPMVLPFARSPEVEPGRDRYEDGNVRVSLMASLAPRDEWTQDVSGWYLFCNKRLVLAADKSTLTGWGVDLPQWHSKFRGFVGAAFFESDNPLDLPWTTTKRGMNRESMVFQKARNRMIVLARPVCDFLTDMYPSELQDRVAERDVAERLERTSVQKEVAALDAGAPASSPFSAKRKRPRRKTTVSVQFNAPRESIEKVKRRLAKPKWGARRVARYCLDHFVKRECP